MAYKYSKPAFFAYVGTGLTNETGDGTDFTIVYDETNQDNFSGFNTGTGIYTVPTGQSGQYIIGAAFQLNGLDATVTDYRTWLEVNATIYQLDRCNAGAVELGGSFYSNNGCISLELEAGDTLKIVTSVTQAGGKTVDFNSGVTLNYFWGVKI